MSICETCNGKKRVIVPAGKTGIGIPAEATCPKCKGTGEVEKPGVCPTCNGSKVTLLPIDKSPLGIATEVDCPECSSPEVID